MRYSTPTHATYRLKSYRTVRSGPYPGPYPVFQHTGYAPGVPVPDPPKRQPKPGHWRTSPFQKVRSAPKPRGTVLCGPMWASTMPRPQLGPTRKQEVMLTAAPLPAPLARAQSRRARQRARKALG